MDLHDDQARVLAAVAAADTAAVGPGWWSDQPLEGTPHRLRYRVGIVRGKHRVTHLCVEPNPDAPVSAQGIRAADLRRIRPGDLLRESAAFWSSLFDGESARAVAALASTPKRWTADDLPRVRDLHLECQSAGRSTRQALQAMGVPASTADRLIHRARQQFPDDMGTATRGPGSSKAKP